MKTVAIVDSRISEKCERALLLLGFEVVKLPPFSLLPEGIASHPDSLLFYYNNEIITSADYSETCPYVFTDIHELIPSVKLTFTGDRVGKEYPHDTVFNAVAMGERLYARLDSVSSKILELAKKHSLKIINTKQGYPACTTLVLSENAAITADAGMARAISESGATVTLIESGDISLPPYEYGFIGGATGVYRDTVYFLGDVSTHRDKEKILAAIAREGMKAKSLSDGPLCDLGGIVFIDKDV